MALERFLCRWPTEDDESNKNNQQSYNWRPSEWLSFNNVLLLHLAPHLDLRCYIGLGDIKWYIFIHRHSYAVCILGGVRLLCECECIICVHMNKVSTFEKWAHGMLLLLLWHELTGIPCTIQSIRIYNFYAVHEILCLYAVQRCWCNIY